MNQVTGFLIQRIDVIRRDIGVLASCVFIISSVCYLNCKFSRIKKGNFNFQQANAKQIQLVKLDQSNLHPVNPSGDKVVLKVASYLLETKTNLQGLKLIFRPGCTYSGLSPPSHA